MFKFQMLMKEKWMDFKIACTCIIISSTTNLSYSLGTNFIFLRFWHVTLIRWEFRQMWFHYWLSECYNFCVCHDSTAWNQTRFNKFELRWKILIHRQNVLPNLTPCLQACGFRFSKTLQRARRSWEVPTSATLGMRAAITKQSFMFHHRTTMWCWERRHRFFLQVTSNTLIGKQAFLKVCINKIET